MNSFRAVDKRFRPLVTRRQGLAAALYRDWRGQPIEVVVEETGFRHAGWLYPSLSAIAEVVTGTRWNAPRFFGLQGKS